MIRPRSEAEVRLILTGVNERIREALAGPPAGPPLNLTPFDIDAIVGQWHAERRGR
ncbi:MULTISPECIES: hypothetical protein [unclassified Streptomyces]|uniref:hypothetical protein n=1 Tax=unclassified Streptomyces TaxID=2593676 RepID=UPI0035DE3B4D